MPKISSTLINVCMDTSDQRSTRCWAVNRKPFADILYWYELFSLCWCGELTTDVYPGTVYTQFDVVFYTKSLERVWSAWHHKPPLQDTHTPPDIEI